MNIGNKYIRKGYKDFMMQKEIIRNLYNSKVLQSGVWYTMASFLTQGVSYITLLIYPRLISEGEYGIINGFTSYLGVFMYLVTLGLQASVANAKQDYKKSFEEYLSSILFLSLIPLSISIGVVWVFREPLSHVINLSSNLILLLVFQSFFSFVMNFYMAKCTIEYDYRKSTVISLSNNILIVLLSIPFILKLQKQKYLGVIGATFIVNSIYALFMYVKIMRNGRKLVNFPYWKYGLKISIPLIPHSLSGTLLAHVDKMMILTLLGSQATGSYSFAYKLGTIIFFLWAALNKAWLPWFYERMNQKDYSSIRAKTRYYIFFFSLATFALIYLSPEIAEIVAPKKPGYRVGLNMVPIIMISQFFIFLYSIPANVEFYFKKNHFISIGTGIAMLINVVLNYIYLPIYGYVVGAWTTLISYIFLYLYHYRVARSLVEENLWEGRDFIYSIGFITLSSILFSFVKAYWYIRYGILLGIVVLAYGKMKVFMRRKHGRE